jgi:hypothetical protein
VTNLSVTTVISPVESEITRVHGGVVLRWASKPDPQSPDITFLVSYTIHGAVQAVDRDSLFTWVALPADFPYAITSTVVSVRPPYPFPESALQFSISVGGAAIANGCYALPGTRAIHGQGACYVDDQNIAFTAPAFTGQPWQISLRYPQAVPAPTAAPFKPTPTPVLQVTRVETPAPYVTSLLALAASGLVVGLLWVWARPAPSLPLHEVIVGSIVAAGATLAVGLLGLIWLLPGSFYWTLDIAIDGALLISSLIIAIWATIQGHVYDRDRQQMLAGQNLAHWTVTAEEHRQFVASEVDRLHQSVWWFLIGTAILTVIFGLIGGLAGIGLATAGLMLAAGLLAIASVAVPYVRLQARYASGQDLGPGELYVSGKGALLFGRYVPLQGFNVWVESVSLVEDAPAGTARLKFRTVSAGRRGSRVVNFVYVPVPADRRAEAEALAASYPITTQ